MAERPARRVPTALRTALSPQELAREKPCDAVRALGSYWSRPDDTDLQSQLVKYFKEPTPRPLERPCMTAIVRAYGTMLADAASEWHPNAVVRVLASAETRPDPARPHSLLARLVSEALSVPEFTHLFFRTEPRKPMRMIDRFSGPEVLRQRIDYVLQDLFVSPADIGGNVLIVDDIYNVGATAAVYAAALKRFCGAEHVYAVNMAAARFSGGKDGWGFLALDVDHFVGIARSPAGPRDPSDSFDDVWIERGAVQFHLRPDCARIGGKSHRSLRFLASRARVPCPACAASGPRSAIRRWLEGRGGAM
jgi:hypothetical protein